MKKNFLLALAAVVVVGVLALSQAPRAQDSLANETRQVTPEEATARAKHIFIVSIDGGKPEVIKQSQMPTLMKMAQEGAVTWGAQTIVPPLTLPSHTSMLTGVKPDKHKVYWNDFHSDKPLSVDTVFKMARQKGLKTALFAGKDKFHQLEIPDSLDKFAIPGYASKDVFQAAAKYIVEEKPNLCFIHIAETDGTGHEFGWGSKQQIEAFGGADMSLQVLRDAVREAGIEKDSTFIVTADHGGHGKTHGQEIPEDMTIPWLAWGAGVKPGEVSDAVNTTDTTATALWLLGVTQPDDLDGKPVVSAFN